MPIYEHTSHIKPITWPSKIFFNKNHIICSLSWKYLFTYNRNLWPNIRISKIAQNKPNLSSRLNCYYFCLKIWQIFGKIGPKVVGYLNQKSGFIFILAMWLCNSCKNFIEKIRILAEVITYKLKCNAHFLKISN